ncbi:U3 small nucleolar RNA-associated protein 6 [Gigaspora margarita]|uniref:U3 small nucleolar RNA-associated protein 6 n=1 Tax=Gigaspora margarita TaxID=4874 RepID=A0A8H4EMW4_GIGMA|nr:U3 small nucleolar RNA-associated protein 6 [Gigaspora margarita]
MAETVQYYLEKMVPELEDYERKELFSKQEIKSIIRQRTNFEYSLKKRPCQKDDFLKYIEYEINLEKLRKKRKERLAIKGKTSISDYAIIRRIYHIFDRAVIKFKGDISLWLQYIEFAKSAGAGKLLGKIFGSALQLHPTKPLFWILAAKWEFETNANITASRALLQRSLRLNPSSIQLWHEYFKLELVYIEKIKSRRKILGISSKSSILEKSNTGDVILISELEDENKLEDNNKVLCGEIVRTVYLNAIDAIPDNLAFRQQFVNICYEFSDTQIIQDTIYESIHKDFNKNAEARAYVAQRHLFSMLDVEKPEFEAAIKNCVNEFQQSVEELADKEIWYLFTKFLNKYLHKVTEKNLNYYLVKLLSQSYETAASLSLASEKMYIEWIDWILECHDSNSKNALDIVRQATEIYPQNSELWVKRIGIVTSLEELQDKSIDELYNLALNKNPTSLVLWDSYLSWNVSKWKGGGLKDHELEKIFTASVSKVASLSLNWIITNEQHLKDTKNMVIARYLTWADEVGGVNKMRQVYKSLLNMILPTPEFYYTCIQIEEKHITSPMALDSKTHLEWLYVRACQSDNTTCDLWLGYIKFLLANNEQPRATIVYEQAMKAVKDPKSLESRYRQMNAKI